MSQSKETRKPTGRPSLLSAEQQISLGQQKTAPLAAAPAAHGAAGAARRKPVWLLYGLIGLALAATLVVVQFGETEAPAATLATAPQAPAPAPAPVPAPEPATATAAPPAEAAPAEAPPLAAITEAAAIVDEAPPPVPVEAKPKESLAQMLESGVPPVAKAAPPKPLRKAAKPVEKAPAKTPAKAPAELDNDVELLAALVAHAKYDTSSNARLSLPKALEQCKKQGKQDAARCRLRVCDGRWRKDECRVYSRAKLEKAASGS